MNLADLLPYFQLVLAACAIVGTVIGSIYALRFGYTKSAQDIQIRVITALKDENETQVKKLDDLNKDVERLRRIIDTIRFALRKRGLRITVNGDFISFYDVQTRTTRTTDMRTTEQRKAKADKQGEEGTEDNGEEDINGLS